MRYQVFTKSDCVYCIKAKNLLEIYELQYDEVTDVNVRERFGSATYPVIVAPDGTLVGGYESLRDSFEEPLLQSSLARFSAFPVEHVDVYELYKKAIAAFWTADEITLAQDVSDFQALSPDEQHFIKHVLAFFASSDGIVNENLLANFSQEIQLAEARMFYAYQCFNESEHNRTYGMLIDALIRDPIERDKLFNAIMHVPAVRKKAEWAMKWLHRPSRRFAERLVAFLCVEGILFSGSFCAIFWLKHHHAGKMPGLCLSNSFIARDENLHCQHAVLLYHKLRRTLTQQEVQAIVGEAVEAEKEFILEAIPCSLLGMNSGLMSQYIEFVADSLLGDMGHAKMFNASNPFGWMELIALDTKGNFFEGRVSEYQRAGVLGDPASQAFGFTDDF